VIIWKRSGSVVEVLLLFLDSAAVYGLVASPLMVSDADAQTSPTTPATPSTEAPKSGTERRQERRKGRTQRRQARRTGRTERREERHDGTTEEKK
jgi:hypothetical protein